MGHVWCWQGHLFIEETGTRHRQEWCAKCGTTRVLFGSGWALQSPDLAKKHPCKGADMYLSQAPERVHSTPSKKRLGRGLKELMTSVKPQTLFGLSKEKK